MTILTINVYPIGHYFQVDGKTLYLAGKRIINKFVNEDLIKNGEYSILLYPMGRVKIEIVLKIDKESEFFKNILNKEIEEGSIVCWKLDDNDTITNVLEKCKATELREGIEKEFGLNSEWTKDLNIINNVQTILNKIINQCKNGEILLQQNYNYLREFIHLITNPLGSLEEGKILNKLNW